jgi:hypothetical protein
MFDEQCAMVDNRRSIFDHPDLRFEAGSSFPKGFIRKIRALMADQAGTVESALVLIPLMVLVLSILQITMGVLTRNIANNQTQSAVTQSGLYGEGGNTPQSTMLNHGLTSSSAFTLSGGGKVYVGTDRNILPSLTPLLPGGDVFTSVGVTVGEGS